MKHSIHEFQPRHSQTFDCDEWFQLLLDSGLHQKITMKIHGWEKSTRFDSPSGYFYIIIRNNTMEIKVPSDSSRSANLFAGGTSFRYVESKIEQLLMREVLGS